MHNARNARLADYDLWSRAESREPPLGSQRATNPNWHCGQMIDVVGDGAHEDTPAQSYPHRQANAGCQVKGAH